MTALRDIVTDAATKMIDALFEATEADQVRLIEAQIERIEQAVKSLNQFRRATRPGELGRSRRPSPVHDEDCRCQACCL